MKFNEIANWNLRSVASKLAKYGIVTHISTPKHIFVKSMLMHPDMSDNDILRTNIGMTFTFLRDHPQFIKELKVFGIHDERKMQAYLSEYGGVKIDKRAAMSIHLDPKLFTFKADEKEQNIICSYMHPDAHVKASFRIEYASKYIHFNDAQKVIPVDVLSCKSDAESFWDPASNHQWSSIFGGSRVLHKGYALMISYNDEQLFAADDAIHELSQNEKAA